MTDDLLTCDVLIIGTGIAGATTALELADAGAAVTLITRGEKPHSSNTYLAQGGIIYLGKGDNAALLAEDLQRAGAGHCNPAAVRILAEQGPEAVREVLLKRAGVAFDRDAEGALSLALEGGHSLPRIIHSADATGKSIETALLNALENHPRVTLLTGHTAVDLLTPDHHGRNRLAVYGRRSCVGAYLLDRASGQVKRAIARFTVLATGGLGQIFLRTTNPQGARGDGLAMAYRAGARVINAEFVQFHPTAFYHQGQVHFLVSEAVRGAGARLAHRDGQPFMQNHAPEWKDLAPRDVVARSIHREMLSRGVSNVYLDLRSYIDRAEILSHFPTIRERALGFGVDIAKDLVPVVPAAHYSCGGIWVDEWGRSTVDGLYSVGEVSCTGVHGANRLASASLLEGLVWGRRAARHIEAQLGAGGERDAGGEGGSWPVEERSKAPVALHNADDIPEWSYAEDGAADPALISQDMSALQQIMWNYVGLVRTTRRLARAVRQLRTLENEIERFYRSQALTDDLVGLRNAVRAAIIVANAAWANRHSVGCHYRE